MTARAHHAGPTNGPVSPRRRPRGFTLVEVMVAATFFLVSFAGMISGIKYATQQYEHQRNLTAAIAVAETVMEQLMLLQQTHPSLSAGNTVTRFYDVDGNELGTSGDPRRKFTGSWTVRGDTPVVGLRTLLLTIRWDEAGATTRSLTLESVRP